MNDPNELTLDNCGCCETDPAPQPAYNRPGLPALAYRAGTYATVFRRMLRQLATYTLQDGDFADTRPLAVLTTREPDDASVALLDASAVVADVLTFYQERIANEGFLRTAVERRSILEMARAIGYELNPGVAAGVYLAFSVEDAQGAPGLAEVPAGTKVQSIPPQGKLPQTFETSDVLTAYKEWNAIRPRLGYPQNIVAGSRKIYLEGMGTRLKAGDRLLIDAGGVQRLAYVLGTEEQSEQKRTVVTLDGGIEPSFTPSILPEGAVDVNTHVTLDETAIETYIRGRQWADDKLNAFLSFNRWDRKELLTFLENDRKENPAASGEAYALRATAGFFGNNAPAFKSLPTGGDVTADYGRTWDKQAHLAVNWWDGSWHWSDQGQPPSTTAMGSPSAVTYLQGGSQRIYIFLRGANGNLYINYWDGSWHWTDQGAPAGTSVVGAPSTITYLQGGTQRIYAFVCGADGGLYVNYWDGSSWKWANQGKPAGTSVVGAPSAITYLQGGTQRIYVFVRGADGKLHVNYWNGSSWNWADQGKPAGTVVASAPAAVTYLDGSTQRIYAFVRGANGHLYVNYWNGSAWNWADQAIPTGTTMMGVPSAITYLQSGLQRIYVFLRGANGRLHVNYWNGSSWNWADQGKPADTTVVETPSTITYLQSGSQRIYCFVRGADGRLYVDYWNGSSWQWADQGIPSDTTNMGAPSAITYLQSGTQRIYVFTQTQGGWQVWMDQQSGDDDSEFDLNYHSEADAYLERVVQGLVKDDGSSPHAWVVFETPQETAMFLIDSLVETSSAAFAMSGKVTGLKLRAPDGGGIDKSSSFRVRNTTAYLQSELLPLVELPITADLVSGTDSIDLDGLVLGLQAGQPVTLSGERMDVPGVTGNEIMTIKEITHTGGFTTLLFESGCLYSYRLDTVTINANTVRATHGETVTEVLGSGDGAKGHQNFTLKKPPLTHVAARTPSGSASTLELRVNNLLWEQAASLYSLDSRDESYIVRIDDDAKPTITFGDGIKGARLPTGENNVTAVYRSGIGLEGQVDAGSLTLLQSKPFGIRGVVNPLAAGGAGDPEKMEDARSNAPLTVRTLDRVVSREDYEDFASAFAGVGKAQAIDLWSGEHHLVHVTIGGADGEPVEDDEFLENFIASLDAARDPAQKVRVDTFDLLLFNLAANVSVDSRYVKEDVFAAIQEALVEAFSFEKRDFGQHVTAAEVITVIQNVAGVVYVDLDALYINGAAGILNQILISAIAHATGGMIQRAQLLLLNELGVSLQEVQA